MGVLGNKIQEVAGSIQLCAGQECGVKAAIHVTCGVFQSSEVEGILLANASNAFNRLNRGCCLLGTSTCTTSVRHTHLSFRRPGELLARPCLP